jgi:hypothetical protein
VKDKVIVDNLIKIISLYIYLKRSKLTSAKEIIESAYYDTAKTRSIFNEITARKILKSLKQSGGDDSQYPYADLAIKALLRDYTPSLINNTIGSAYGLITGTVDNVKSSIPFSDLVLEALQLSSEFGVTAANDAGQAVAGPIGAVVVAPFTAIATALSTMLAAGEGDLGGAVAHMANWIPIIGIILSKGIIQAERMAIVLKDYPTLASFFPYMEEYHRSLPIGGKRLSTMKHKHTKWKTQRRRFATL